MSRSSDEDSLIEYPCEFHLKVVGPIGEPFKNSVRDIVERHTGTLSEDSVRQRTSRNGNFVALTFCFEAKSRDQLDSLYSELSNKEGVLMVL